MIVFLSFAACVVSSIAAPACKPTYPDWKAIQDNFKATIELMKVTEYQLVSIVSDNKDNPTVGVTIEDKWDEVAVKVSPSMLHIDKAIRRQSLTVAVTHAKSFYEALKNTLLVNLEAELAQLPIADADQIRDILKNAYARVEQQEQELIGHLSQ